MSETPMLNQLNLMVGDMAATVAFYRKLGLAQDAPADAQHVEFRFPSGMVVEFDTADSVGTWDSCPPPGNRRWCRDRVLSGVPSGRGTRCTTT